MVHTEQHNTTLRKGKTMISDKELAKTMLPMRIIWLCLVLAPLFYLFVGIYMEDGFQANLDAKTFENIKMMIYILSFVTLIVTGYVRNHLLSRQKNPQNHDQSSKDPAMQKYFVSMIVALAMLESIAIFGLVLFFLGKDRTDLYLLTLVSSATMLFYFPKKEHIRLLTEDHEHG